MKIRRSFFLTLALLAVAAPLAMSYHPIGRYNTSVTPNTMVPAGYDLNTLPNSTLTFFVTDQRPQTLASSDTLEAVMSQVAAATLVWNSVSTSRLRMQFGGFSNVTASTPRNPMGLIRFTANLPPGAAAAGGPQFTVPSGSPTVLPILHSAVFMPTDLSQTISSAGFYLPVLVHEIGHSIGLNHSVANSVMFQTRLTTRARVLTEDDVAGISSIYPSATFASSTGSISGRVTNSAGQGVSVAAVSAYTDTQVFGAFTNPDGNYTIRGLAPGTYRLMVQPLMKGAVPSSSADNAGDPADLVSSKTLTGQVVTINTNLNSAFIGAAGAPAPDPIAAATFSVNAGQTTSGANVTVAARGALRLEANTAASFPGVPFGVNSSVPQIWVQQGGQVIGGAEGVALTTTGINIRFTNPGITFVPGSLSLLDGSDPIFPTFVRFDVRAAAGTTPGSHTAIYQVGTETYFSPGHVRVVATAPPRITSISPTSGAAGTTVTISGTSFADAAQVMFDGMQATVSSRSATSLVVTAPQGAPLRASAVSVNNPDGQGTDFTGAAPTFTFGSAPAASIAISPANAATGSTANITITGTNTNFRSGVTTVGFGSGDVTVNSVTVNSATSLVANITVRPAVDSSSFPVTVVTGQQIIYLQPGLALGGGTPGIATTLRAVSGGFQEGTPGTALPNSLVVRAETSGGAAVSGVTVTFAATFGGGSVSPATAVTDAAGQASTRLTLGASTGFNIVSATATGLTPIGFILGAGAGSTNSIGYGLAVGTNNQTGPVNTSLPNQLGLQVRNTSGTPMPGVPVTWEVTGGGGSISLASRITDSTGVAFATWTLGPTVGSQTVVGKADGYSGVTFTATATAATGPTPIVPSNGVLNGAGFDSSVSGLSAGVIASLFGTNLSTATAQAGLAPGTTSLVTTLNGTRVTFDGIAAPLFFVSAGQLNVQVPFEVAGRSSTQVVVSLNGVASAPVTVTLRTATPGFFTVLSNGRGAAVVLNQDGSLNTAGNPAARGSVVQFFATGLGPVFPASPTGQLSSTSVLSLSVEIPTVTFSGASANVEFSGLAPGFVGLWQLNARVPSGAAVGEASVVMRISGQNANAVTVFVRE